LGALLDQPALLVSEYAEQLRGLLTAPELVDVCSAVQAALQENGELELSALLSALEKNPHLEWVRERLALAPVRDEQAAQELLQKSLPKLARDMRERDLQRLAREVVEARRNGDDARAVELTKQRDELLRSAK